MRVVVTLESRFERTPDGCVWCSPLLDHAMWRSYLAVFDEVHVVARVREVAEPPPNSKRADIPQVTFASVPPYEGAQGFVRKFFSVRKAVRAAVGAADAVIMHVPGNMANCLVGPLYRARRPYALEVVGDPRQVFAPGGVPSRARPLLRWWYPRQLREQCARAAAVLYVTAETLQRLYPPSPRAYVTACSDIQLPPEAYVPAPRRAPAPGAQVHLVTVGSLDQLYKAPDVLISAVAANVRRGADIRLTLIGDGRYRPALERLAASSGLAGRVHFLGWLHAGAPVRAALDRADLFVLPSRTEGLPRALIEAMARGLPCIGSAVGGIPELLPPAELVPPGDVGALAAKIAEVLASPQRMEQMAARALDVARGYRLDLLTARRRAFYEAVRDLTHEWFKRG